VPAANQEIILQAFQEERWPACIDDPLPPHPCIDPKRRLHDTLNSLNRHQREPFIHFFGNGKGEGVRWQPGPAPGSGGPPAPNGVHSPDAPPASRGDDRTPP
jgi:hypothetical protein